MSDLFDLLYKPVISSGISPIEFWDLTYGEMCDIINAQNYNQQNMIFNQYNHACMIADFIGRGLAGKDIPSVWELFPQIEKPKELIEQEDKIAINFYKDQFSMFADKYNEQRKRT